jgi:hypothetical protein
MLIINTHNGKTIKIQSNQFESLESTPMLLGLQTAFKDHRQGRDP